MVSWSAKRKLIYSTGFFLVLVIIFSIIFFKFIYTNPTCKDGIKNGDETGIDCGGSCKNVCTNDALSPIISWAKSFNVSGDVYNLAAYVENTNLDSKNLKATYEFKIFDDKNILLGVRDGETFIPKNKKFIIFEPGFNISNRKPKYVEFKFTSFGTWQKDVNTEPEIDISYSSLNNASTTPNISGTVSNKSFQNIAGLELTVVVLDNNENAVATSRTFIDSLSKGSSQDFVFTWPKPFTLGTESCTTPLDIVLVIDRSGSMKSEGLYPPEPFDTVKNTAENFVNTLGKNDRVAIISFGTDSKVESSLTNITEQSLSAINNLAIATSSKETNIAGGLLDSLNELKSNFRSGAKQIIIMLTDGVPTEPKKTGDATYPASFAKAVSNAIASTSASLYAIGLGKDVSDTFLKTLVVSNSHYFSSPTKENLNSIYNKINSTICTKKPSVVNVIYRILQ